MTKIRVEFDRPSYCEVCKFYTVKSRECNYSDDYVYVYTFNYCTLFDKELDGDYYTRRCEECEQAEID